MEAGRRATDDEMGQGCLPLQGVAGISSAADGPQELAEPQWSLATRHRQGGGRGSDREDPIRADPGALSRRVRSLRRYETGQSPVVSPDVHLPQGMARAHHSAQLLWR